MLFFELGECSSSNTRIARLRTRELLVIDHENCSSLNTRIARLRTRDLLFFEHENCSSSNTRIAPRTRELLRLRQRREKFSAATGGVTWQLNSYDSSKLHIAICKPLPTTESFSERFPRGFGEVSVTFRRWRRPSRVDRSGKKFLRQQKLAKQIFFGVTETG